MKTTFTKRTIPNREVVLYIYKGEKCFYLEEGFMVPAAGARHRSEVEIAPREFIEILESQFKKDNYENESRENLLKILDFVIS